MRKTLFFCFLFFLSLFASAQIRPVKSKPINFTERANYEKTLPTPSVQIPKEADEWEEEIERNNFLSPTDQRIRRFTPPQISNQQNYSRPMSPIPTNNFNALDDNAGIIPPDCNGVVGPNHLMVTLNSEYRIMDKTGTVISTTTASGFWAGVTPAGFADPHVMYDHYTGRWIIVGQSTTAATSALLVAVSQTNDPTGTWNRYAFDVDAANTIWFDFPLIGFNQNWLVVAGNMFNVSNNFFANKCQIYVFDMSVLNAGAAVTIGTNAQLITTPTSDGSFSMSPATNFGSTNSMFLLENWNGGSGALRLSRLTGTIPGVLLNSAAAAFPVNGSLTWQTNPNPSGDFSPQLGDVRKIAANDARMNNVVMRNGKLWAAHHVFLPGTSTTTRAAIQWWVIDTTTNTPVQIGTIDDATGAITRSFPSIAVDASENVLIGYSVFSASMYASSAYSYRQSCTPANTMQSEVIYKSGLSSYFKNFGGTRDRWGDYSHTSLDPVTGHFWTIQEYAAQRTGVPDNSSRWGTWWADVTPQVSANNVFFANSSIGQVTESSTTTSGCRKYTDYTISVGVSCSATGNSTLTFTNSGTAVLGSDYNIIPASISYTNGDAALKTATLRIYDDEDVESNETINLGYSISGAGVIAGSTAQTQTITIVSNDNAPLAAGGIVSGTVGNGGNTTSNTVPFRSNFSDARTQMLYTAAELSAQGLIAGNITKLAFTVSSKGSAAAFNGFTIKLKNTTSTSISTGTFESGTTTALSPVSYSTVIGLNEFTLTTPFAWDGISNLLVDVCFDNASAEASTDIVTSTVTATSLAAWDRQNGVVGCSIASSAFNSVSGVGFIRPDVKFTIDVVGTTIASALNTTYTFNFGPNADSYIYSGGQILARLKNLSSFDYGCTQVIIDRDNTTVAAASKKFWNNNTQNFLASKTYKVIPTNANPSGSYEITMYYTQAEVTGWQTATGQLWSSAKVVKVPTAIDIITPASPNTGIVVDIGSVPVAFGNNFSIKGSFSTGFSGFGAGVPGSSALPVTLLNFDGEKKNKTVELSWRTSFEYNNDHFEIETTKNGVDFYHIGSVKSLGNSTVTQAYNFTDNIPVKGTNYYRLKQVDIDAKKSYSRIIAITFDEKGRSIVIYPNPATEKLTLSFSKPEEKVNINILSSDGRLVSKQSLGSVDRSKDIQISNLPAGSYLLQILIGKDKQTVVFVKE